MSIQAKEPKFYFKNGDLTPYSFACGYVQWASKTGKYIDHWENGKKMYLDSVVYHVQHYKDGKQTAWESFDTLKDAIKYYRLLSIN